MSSYGPQGGGPYPGQPQDPWGDTPTDGYSSGYPDPLTEAGFGPRPASPSPYGAGAGSGPGVYGGRPGPAPGPGVYGGRPSPAPGSVTGEVWGPPRPSTRPGRTGPSGTAIGVIIVVVLLALAGAGIAAVFLTRDDGRKPTGGGGGQSRAPSASASTPGPSASSPNADAKAAKVGDCLINRGTSDAPDMQKVQCGKDAYQVLKRIDGTSDKNKCDGTPGRTDWYFFDHPDDKLDFVLCLKKLPN